MGQVRRTQEEVLDNITKAQQARRRHMTLKQDIITMSHGAGGKSSHELIEGLIRPILANPVLDSLDDAAVLPLSRFVSLGNGNLPELAFTTDSYTVSPVKFPGGNIGDLAVNGTVNDLAMSGARPIALSLGLILEEGLPVALLREVLESIAAHAKELGISIVTGDTKVVPRGKGDGLYINTAGIGIVERTWPMGQHLIQPGDKVLISGSVGDHGIAVMLRREGLEMESEVQSDTQSLYDLVHHLFVHISSAIHALKDPTRGGVATTLNEMAVSSDVAIKVYEDAVPVKESVRGACEILGLDPLTIANEGKMLVVVAKERAEEALSLMRQHPKGQDARIIGEVQEEPRGMVFLQTVLGGTRVLDMLVGDPLPRIC
ncbi:hydrogenase expression/formation protein HypE (plasmid) [Sulfobacillus acidophilus DSM 10332]|uniref:Hydrogenase expression/formation protein HypE n=1 Tax=Sulfobacillus acidophilus (strain ATCC 700253 / DSM 10332 / NAL) TaxID=679936 RepID=G8U1W0_SULAD|nr:hydrogenase expression/formation protein HypE [Sulfobacillus acidophilus DSM 10332]